MSKLIKGLITDTVYSIHNDTNILIFTKIYDNYYNYFEIIITNDINEINDIKPIYFSLKNIPQYLLNIYNYTKKHSRVSYDFDTNSYTFYGINLFENDNKEYIIANFIECDFPIFKNMSFDTYDTYEYFNYAEKFIDIEKNMRYSKGIN